MINRRDALLGLGAAVLTTAVPSASALTEFFGASLPLDQTSAEPPQNTADAAIDENLRKDLASMASRADSEEGVPVLLACVNLVSDKTSKMIPAVRRRPLNPMVAAEYHRNAAAWQRVKPNAQQGDVGSLIQVLAVRDFANGGREAK